MAPTKGAKCYRRYDRLCVRGPGHRPHLFNSSGDEAKMGTGKSTQSSRPIRRACDRGRDAGSCAGPDLGPGCSSDARIQAEAAVALRILAGRPAYAETGEGVGRVADVRVGPNRASLVGIVTVRPRFGWGRIVVPGAPASAKSADGWSFQARWLRSARCRDCGVDKPTKGHTGGLLKRPDRVKLCRLLSVREVRFRPQTGGSPRKAGSTKSFWMSWTFTYTE